MNDKDIFEMGKNPLKTFWVGDLEPDLLKDLLIFVRQGTCWNNDGISGNIDLKTLTDSLFRLKAGLPARKGDRLLLVKGGYIEFHICMEDENEGKIQLKKWSGNGGGDGWADKPKVADAIEYRKHLIGDLQMIILALYRVGRLRDHQNMYVDFAKKQWTEKSQKMADGWRAISLGQREFFENDNVSGIDIMISGLEAYIEYEASDSFNLPVRAAAARLAGPDGLEDFDYNVALSFLENEQAKKMQLVFLAKNLLLALKNRLGSPVSPSEKESIPTSARKQINKCLPSHCF